MELASDNNQLFAFPVLSTLKRRNKSPKVDNHDKYIFKWLKDSNDPNLPRRNNDSIHMGE